jgi:AbrB family looped-hinge helix DNA binding protein
MPIARMTTNGRITIPLEIRKSLRLVPGAKVEFVEKDGERFVLIPVNDQAPAAKS